MNWKREHSAGFDAGEKIARLALGASSKKLLLPGWEGVLDSSLDFSLSPSSFISFKPAPGAFRTGAIDGGNATIIDARSLVVSARRSSFVLMDQDANTIEEGDPEQKVDVATITNARELCDEALVECGGAPIPGNGRVEPESVSERLRALDELLVAEGLLGKLSRGDLLMVDGALQSDASLPKELLARLCQRAAKMGVHLIGISKSTNLCLGGFPLLPCIGMMTKQMRLDAGWFVHLTSGVAGIEDADGKKVAGITGGGAVGQQLGRIYAVRFDPLSKQIFRVDVNVLDDTPPEEIFGKVARLCNDAVYPGYPYPLAVVHNNVAFEGETLEELRHLLRMGASSGGLSDEGWEDAFGVFHDVLDSNRW